MIVVTEYFEEAAPDLVKIYFNTIHKVNCKDYNEKQLDAWAPTSSLEVDGWMKRFSRTKPLVALVEDQIVGFAEFEPNGHIDCFYCHHEWIGKGVGKTLVKEILSKARKDHLSLIFVEASITAKSFFESQGFKVLKEQEVLIRGELLTNYKMEQIL
jgi:putative acetyltransferase